MRHVRRAAKRVFSDNHLEPSVHRAQHGSKHADVGFGA